MTIKKENQAVATKIIFKKILNLRQKMSWSQKFLFRVVIFFITITEVAPYPEYW